MKRFRYHTNAQALPAALALIGLLGTSQLYAAIDRSLCDEKGHFATTTQIPGNQPPWDMRESITVRDSSIQAENQALQKAIVELLTSSSR